MVNSSFASRIRTLRKSNGLTMQELADELSISKAAVSQWENSGVVPRLDQLRKLSKLFRVSIEELVKESTEEISNQDQTMFRIQKVLVKMNPAQIEKAEKLLRLIFDDIFE
ncbi:helix-turn-helix transcriptional regulator [Ileibacterium valens]|uniref:helix-turn-helix domain-containing protein n=1 Tax=Ileibacterium valens TaxID=1862668 RepID=UPI003515EE03